MLLSNEPFLFAMDSCYSRKSSQTIIANVRSVLGDATRWRLARLHEMHFIIYMDNDNE